MKKERKIKREREKPREIVAGTSMERGKLEERFAAKRGCHLRATKYTRD